MKDKVPEHSEVWRGRWERMTEKLDDADERRAGLGPQPALDQLVVALVAAVLFAVVVLCDLSVNEEWFVPAAVGAVTLIAILALPGDRLQAPRPRAPRARRTLAGVRALDRGLPAALRRSRRRRSRSGSGSWSTGSPSAPPSG